METSGSTANTVQLDTVHALSATYCTTRSFRSSRAHHQHNRRHLRARRGKRQMETEIWVGADGGAKHLGVSTSSSTSSWCERRQGLWVVLTENYVLQNFLSHLIAPHNIRYRHKTFAEHCHHQTVDWDAHPFCVECVSIFHDVVKEAISPANSATWTVVQLIPPATTSFCLGAVQVCSWITATSPPTSTHKFNADLYARKNRFLELPNPAWFLNDEPDGVSLPPLSRFLLWCYDCYHD